MAEHTTTAWLRLARVPNLITVPGDPLAGFIMVGGCDGGAAARVVVAALCLYLFGLFTNDLFDQVEDAKDRPDRPLPSGALSRSPVVVASVILVLGGTLAAFSASRSAGGCAVVLAAMVLAYNAGLKPVPVLGALTMGLCRGLSLVMGALAAGYPGFVDAQGVAVLTAAAGMVLYVAGLSGVARRETETVSPGGLRWVPALVVGAWMGLSWVPGLLVQVPSVWILGVALAWCTYVGMTLNGQPSPVKVGAAVGAWVRGLLFLQAAVVFMVSPVGEWVGAGLLMVGWPLHAWLSRRFYAS